MSLDKIGSYSLQAVNQWVNVINANLQGTSRTAFKTTRVSFSDGIGVTRVEAGLDSPPTTLTVNATTVDWGQGSILNTDSSTDFAIQGEGFFVVANNAGQLFVTRDGEFHWSDEGYLVNSSGLKVLSSGQDFIRMHNTDRSDVFNIDGESIDLDHYGDKSFLLVDFENLQGLRMSQYGSTVFEVPGSLPLRLQNDFATTTDGISYIDDDPLMEPIVNDPGFVAYNGAVPTASDFAIDFGDNGVFVWSVDGPSAGDGLDITATSINGIVGAINAWAIGAGVNVGASYDPSSDRLTIANDVTGVGGPAGNRIVFDGPNGAAVREFFKLGSNHPDNGNGSINQIESKEDIDNGDGYSPLDITPIIQAGANISTLLEPRDAGFTHIKVTDTLAGNQTGGTIISDTRTNFAPLFRASHMVIGESQTTGEFDVSLDFRVSNEANGRFTFSFGQDNAHSISSGGYELQFDVNAGTVQLIQRPEDPDQPVLTIGAPVAIGGAFSTAFTAATTPPSPTAANQAINQLRVTLDARTRNLSVNLNGNAANFSLIGDRDLFTGYLSVGNRLNVLEMHSLEADFKARYNTERNGMLVSVSPTDVSHVYEKNAWQRTGRSRIVQAAKETSNSSITEYVPMLATAQKVFSAISKIISTHNNTVDDLNSLIR